MIYSPFTNGNEWERTGTSTTTVLVTGPTAKVTVGYGFGGRIRDTWEAVKEADLFSMPLHKCRAPIAILVRWIDEMMQTKRRPTAKIAGKADIRPAIRPARRRDIHHGEHLLNFHMC